MSLKLIRRDMARVKCQRELTIQYFAHSGHAPCVRVHYGGWHDPHGPEREFMSGTGFGPTLKKAAEQCWLRADESRTDR